MLCTPGTMELFRRAAADVFSGTSAFSLVGDSSTSAMPESTLFSVFTLGGDDERPSTAESTLVNGSAMVELGGISVGKMKFGLG